MTVDRKSVSSEVVEAYWPEHRKEIAEIRRQVFIEEQQVPEALEWDELDDTAKHLCIFSTTTPGVVVAYARLLPQGKLTRMAVLAPYRKCGLGSTLVTQALRLARDAGLERVILDAQCDARLFYAKHGFSTQGDEFWEAGIKHICMVRNFNE